MISPRLARAVRGGQALALAGLVAYVLHATGVVYADADWLFDDWVYNGLLVVASIGCLARAVAVRHERGPWLLMGLGIAAWTLGDLHYTFYLSGLEESPFPSIGDAFYLAFYPATSSWPRRRWPRPLRPSRALRGSRAGSCP